MKLNKIFSFTVALAVATFALSGCIRETFPKEAGITENQLMKNETAVILQGLLPGIHAGLISTAGYYEHTDYGYYGLQVYHDYECKNCVANGWLMGQNPLYNRFFNASYGWYYTANSLMPAMTWMAYYPIIKSCNHIIGIAADYEECLGDLQDAEKQVSHLKGVKYKGVEESLEIDQRISSIGATEDVTAKKVVDPLDERIATLV